MAVVQQITYLESRNSQTLYCTLFCYGKLIQKALKTNFSLIPDWPHNELIDECIDSYRKAATKAITEMTMTFSFPQQKACIIE